MIRSSKHIIKYQTKTKSIILSKIFNDFQSDVEFYINQICSNKLELKKNLSSKLLPSNKILHSQWKQIAYKTASEIIRSQIKKANNKRFKHYQKIYYKCIKNNKRQLFTSKTFKDLNLKNIIYTKFFTKPDLNNISINLDSRLIDFNNESYHFDEFVRIKTPYFYQNKKRAICLNIPIKHHKHSNKFKNWKRKSSIRLRKNHLNQIFIDLIYENDKPEIKQKGQSIGIDQGYKKLLTCSNGRIYDNDLNSLYNKISNKLQGSKSFKRLLKHRDNLINKTINDIDINNLKEIVIEDLKNVKSHSKNKIYKKTMNKMQRWSYTQCIDKLERLCEENGILLTKVNPAYTSQCCSSCGHIDKLNRSGERFKCQCCGYENDADVNAAINISRMGVYNPHSPINKFDWII